MFGLGLEDCHVLYEEVQCLGPVREGSYKEGTLEKPCKLVYKTLKNPP